MLLDEFEWVGLVVVLKHNELIWILRLVNIIDRVLQPVDEWLDRLTFDLLLITIHVSL